MCVGWGCYLGFNGGNGLLSTAAMNFEAEKRCKKIREKMLRLCGDRSIGEANLHKGVCPFNGSDTAARGVLDIHERVGWETLGEKIT